MLTDVLRELYERDLAKLKTEIGLYENEADLWEKPGDVPNSVGNLCLHLNGNLQHFFGAVLGGTGYVRDRDAEFASRAGRRDDLARKLRETAAVVASTLG